MNKHLLTLTFFFSGFCNFGANNEPEIIKAKALLHSFDDVRLASFSIDVIEALPNAQAVMTKHFSGQTFFAFLEYYFHFLTLFYGFSDSVLLDQPVSIDSASVNGGENVKNGLLFYIKGVRLQLDRVLDGLSVDQVLNAIQLGDLRNSVDEYVQSLRKQKEKVSGKDVLVYLYRTLCLVKKPLFDMWNKIIFQPILANAASLLIQSIVSDDLFRQRMMPHAKTLFNKSLFNKEFVSNELKNLNRLVLDKDLAPVFFAKFNSLILSMIKVGVLKEPQQQELLKAKSTHGLRDLLARQWVLNGINLF